MSIASGSRTRHAVAAAVPFAAALTLGFADRLPLRFEYRPNDLGIVSRATLLEYPVQQDAFWYAFALVCGFLLTWGLARAFRGLDAPTCGPGPGLACEILGGVALGGALWLPRSIGELAAIVLTAFAWGIARHLGSADAGDPEDTSAARPKDFEASPAQRLAVRAHGGRRAILAVALAAIAVTYSSHPFYPDGLLGGLANVVQRVPDLRLASDDAYFHGEWGEHLAWGDRMLRGELPGRDFFCLYGPLHEGSLVALWELLGRSVAAFTLWQGALLASGMAATLILGLGLVGRPVSLLLLPGLLPFVSLRLGLGLLVIAALVQWRRTGTMRWCAVAGGLAGTALVFSQEFGLAALIVAGLALLLAAERRPALAFALAAVAVPLAVGGYFALRGGLIAMLGDLVAYPSYVAAGYANLPFPQLFDVLPIDLGSTQVAWKVTVRIAYALPAIAAGAFLLCLPLPRMDPRRPRALLEELRGALLEHPARFGVTATALFGLLAFRAGLGRSDLEHLAAVAAPSALLLCVACDRILSEMPRLTSGDAGAWARAAWRTAVLLAVAVHSGLPAQAHPQEGLASVAGGLARLWGGDSEAVESPRVGWLTAWLQERTEPDDAVFLLPNLASYYYLAERRNPTRFALSAMIVTSAHRREVRDALASDPPRFVVRDERGIQIDHLTEEQVLGAATVRWLDEHYEPVVQHDGFAILARRSAQPHAARSIGEPSVDAPIPPLPVGLPKLALQDLAGGISR